MSEFDSTIVQDREEGTSLNGEKIIEENLNEYQVEEFLFFTYPEESSQKEELTTISEKREERISRKFLVESYHVIPHLNRRIAGRNGFRSLNKWEGIVVDIGKEEFSAILTDLTHGGPKEQVTLTLDEVSEQDLALLKPGAIFYWNIGYEVLHGQRRKASIIRFKRLPKWDKKDWDQILDKANGFEKDIEWE